MRNRTRRGILASLVLVVAQYAMPVSAEDPNLDWLIVTSDRFSLAAEYPAALFDDPLMTYGGGDTVWFGPNRNGAMLMISAVLAGEQSSYARVCVAGCPNTIDTVAAPAVGVVSGSIGEEVYYSKCLLADGRQSASLREMHCFHIIYQVMDRATYDPIVAHMSAALR
jgi:hypothetical protein